MQTFLEFGNASGSAANNPKKLERVILHLDMDCFYCQVEQVRLSIPHTIPLAIQQWQNVIAVNYPARAAGVTRHASYRECLAVCPELQLVHVPTYSTENPTAGVTVYGAGKWDLSKMTHKASLQPYREASMKVFGVLRRALGKFGAPFVMEKASIDEVFVDVSEIVDSIMSNDYGFTIQKGKIVEKGKFNPLTWTECGKPAVQDITDAVDQTIDDAADEKIPSTTDLRIFIGSQVAQKLRNAVYQELQYTASAGIAVNKTLAKLASARHKPDQQTFVRPCHVNAWMKQVPFNKIRFLGGKLGKLLLKTMDQHHTEDGDEEEGVNSDDNEESTPAAPVEQTVMASDMWPLTMEELSRRLGDPDSAAWVYGVIRGHDHTPVSPRLQAKSFMSAKQLSPSVKEWQQLNDWLLLLIGELVERLQEDLQVNERWPKSLTVYFKRASEKSHSKAIDFTFTPNQLPAKNEALAKICLDLLVAEGGVLPCKWMAVAVSKFKPFAESKQKTLTMVNPSAGSRQTALAMVNPSTESKQKASTMANLLGPNAKKKKMDLTDFFPTTTTTGYKCPKCSRFLNENDPDAIQEHQDYHFALDLQKSINP